MHLFTSPRSTVSALTLRPSSLELPRPLILWLICFFSAVYFSPCQALFLRSPGRFSPHSACLYISLALLPLALVYLLLTIASLFFFLLASPPCPVQSISAQHATYLRDSFPSSAPSLILPSIPFLSPSSEPPVNLFLLISLSSRLHLFPIRLSASHHRLAPLLP